MEENKVVRARGGDCSLCRCNEKAYYSEYRDGWNTKYCKNHGEGHIHPYDIDRLKQKAKALLSGAEEKEDG